MDRTTKFNKYIYRRACTASSALLSYAMAIYYRLTYVIIVTMLLSIYNSLFVVFDLIIIQRVTPTRATLFLYLYFNTFAYSKLQREFETKSIREGTHIL